MANLLSFNHDGGILKLLYVLYSPNLKLVLIFLVTKGFNVSLSHEILCYALVDDGFMVA